MIGFSTLKGLSIPEGVVTQIADASGRVLWRSTIKFTINGDTYIADRGMTWAEWFASDYNTTGETEGTITDSNGNEVSMDAVIVGGTAYEVGFAPAEATVTMQLNCTFHTPAIHLWLVINGTKYKEIYSPTEITVPIGTVIQCCFSSAYSSNKIYLNENVIAEGMETYDYTVTGDISIQGGLKVTGGGMGSPGSISERYFKITEQ